jgi:N-acetyl-alpha-D-muramate 1-phosphate uridylyltransferase
VSLPVAILCGGLGTRLYPLTQNRPKALVEIAGEAFIAHQLRLLRRSGIAEAVLCLGHYSDMVLDYVGDGRRFGLAVECSVDGPELLGTAGALKKALPLLGAEFFVMYGDSYLPCDYQTVERRFHGSGKQALMTVFRNEGRWDHSNVELSDSGSICVYDKKNSTPQMRHVDYGLGVFRAAAFDRVPAKRSYDLADLYRELLRGGELSAYEVKERFYEVGSFDGIEELTALLSLQAKR